MWSAIGEYARQGWSFAVRVLAYWHVEALGLAEVNKPIDTGDPTVVESRLDMATSAIRREVEIGTLPDGTRFRCNMEEGWVYGTLIYASSPETKNRARVRLDGQQRHVVFNDKGKRREFDSSGASVVNWPWTIKVEVVANGSGAAEQDPQEMRFTMTEAAKEKAMRARYEHQQKQLAAATTDEKKASIQSKIDSIVEEAEAAGVNLVEAAPAPAKPEAKGDKLKAANTARLAALKEKKAAEKAKAPAKPKGEKKLEANRDCLCGCGTETTGKFAPGHDARVKGLLLKVERGLEPKSAIPESLAPYVRFSGNPKTAGKDDSDFAIVKAPVRFPGRPDIELAEV